MLCTSVVPVCLSRSYILSKQINISSIFTSRRLCIARTMPRQDVCLSVRPSVCHTRVFCLTVTYILKLFTPSGSPTIVVFRHQTGWQYSDGDPTNGGFECQWGMKRSRFSILYLHFVSEMIFAFDSYYGRQIGNRTHAFQWYQFE